MTRWQWQNELIAIEKLHWCKLTCRLQMMAHTQHIVLHSGPLRKRDTAQSLLSARDCFYAAIRRARRYGYAWEKLIGFDFAPMENAVAQPRFMQMNIDELTRVRVF